MGYMCVVVGVGLLWAGAEALVRGASELAVRLGMRPLVVGLTVVSFCTSMPEAAASFEAQIFNLDSIAIGNILGSNIANVGLILGLTALICPLPISALLRRREVPLMVGALWVFLVLMGLGLGRVAGIILLVLLGFYLALQVWWHRDERNGAIPLRSGWWLELLQVVLGAAALAAGGYLLVQGALVVARSWGMSERVAGLTIVAIGTSLPELAATLAASMRGHPGLALGNIVGSNLFNVLFIGGGAALIRPLRFNQEMLWVDGEVMIFFSLLLWGMVWLCSRVGRTAGVLLVILYGLYLGFLTR